MKLGSFQNASIEIEQMSFVYQQNRFTVILVLMITDLILASQAEIMTHSADCDDRLNVGPMQEIDC